MFESQSRVPLSFENAFYFAVCAALLTPRCRQCAAGGGLKCKASSAKIITGFPLVLFLSKAHSVDRCGVSKAKRKAKNNELSAAVELNREED